MIRVVVFLLRVYRRRLERAIDRPFDPRRSRELDSVIAALEALTGAVRGQARRRGLAITERWAVLRLRWWAFRRHVPWTPER